MEQNETVNTQHERTLRLVLMAMLAAISIVLVYFVRIPLVPAAPFLEYDMADVPVMLAAFLISPSAGLLVLFVVSVIQAFLLGGNGIIGLIMHFFASGALVLGSALIYKACRQKKGSLIAGLVIGSLLMTLLMIPLNFIFTPKVMMDVPIAESASVFFSSLSGNLDPAAHSEAAVGAYQAVKGLLLPGLIPFNLIKAGLNSAIFFILFKSLRFILDKRAH
ncbi:MAG: ECF transporter S component [Firmicutes bacterium]|nr:ECF transporter S component [Bacillota bacterium]